MKYFIKYTLTIAACLLLTACFQNSDKDLKDVADAVGKASLTVTDVHSCITDSGYIKYEFESPEMQQFDDVEEPYIYFPNGLKFRMYAENGTLLKSRIRCNNATYYKTTKIWELNNDVEAMTQKGDILNTEQMFWDTENHRIYSEKFVKITTTHQIITGKGFESDEKLSYYEIKHPGGEIELENN